MIWFTSDTHYHHVNICRGASVWPNKAETRNFDKLSQMNDAIVNAINRHVSHDDTLYHLGDWSFGGVQNVWKFRQRINCQTIHLILGNHDQHIKKNKSLIVSEEDRVYFDSLGLYEVDIHPQDLFTSVQGYLELETDDQILVLSHYPMEEWLEMDRKGGVMLHGHCHHKIDNCETNTLYKRMDVGLDWQEFRPYSFDEIIKTMSKRDKKIHTFN